MRQRLCRPLLAEAVSASPDFDSHTPSQTPVCSTHRLAVVDLFLRSVVSCNLHFDQDEFTELKFAHSSVSSQEKFVSFSISAGAHLLRHCLGGRVCFGLCWWQTIGALGDQRNVRMQKEEEAASGVVGECQLQ